MFCAPVVRLELGGRSVLVLTIVFPPDSLGVCGIWVCGELGPGQPAESTDSGCEHLVTGILVVWSSLRTLRSVVLSDLVWSFLVCFGSTGLGLINPLVWFIPGFVLSRVPVGLESANVCDLTASAVCVFAREGIVGELRYVPDALIFWKEVFLTARSEVWVLCCSSS